MIKVLLVGIGGLVGAIARYGISGLVHRLYNGSFPLGTLTVNVLGCFVIGAVMTLVDDRQFFSPHVRVFVMIGLLGSLTTFSTFGYETFELMRDHMLHLALFSVLTNVILGITAVILGRAVMKMIGV